MKAVLGLLFALASAEEDYVLISSRPLLKGSENEEFNAAVAYADEFADKFISQELVTNHEEKPFDFYPVTKD
jgi:hypothetical protein